jgi:flagellin-specific chaperone FliS
MSIHKSHDDLNIDFELVSSRDETIMGWDDLYEKVVSLVSCAQQHLKSGRKVEAYRCVTHANSIITQIRSMLEQQIIEEASPAIPSRLLG